MHHKITEKQSHSKDICSNILPALYFALCDPQPIQHAHNQLQEARERQEHVRPTHASEKGIHQDVVEGIQKREDAPAFVIVKETEVAEVRSGEVVEAKVQIDVCFAAVATLGDEKNDVNVFVHL